MLPIIEVECPGCGDYLTLAGEEDQTIACRECRRWYWASYDAEFLLDSGDGHWKGTWTLTEEDGPDWDEVAGDLKFHEMREEGRW
jgi:hypothetical protein